MTQRTPSKALSAVMIQTILLFFAMIFITPAFAQKPRVLISFDPSNKVVPEQIYVDLYRPNDMSAPLTLTKTGKRLKIDLAPGAQIFELPAGRHMIRVVIFDEGDPSRTTYIALNYSGHFKKGTVYFLGRLTIKEEDAQFDTSADALKSTLLSLSNADLLNASITPIGTKAVFDLLTQN